MRLIFHLVNNILCSYFVYFDCFLLSLVMTVTEKKTAGTKATFCTNAINYGYLFLQLQCYFMVSYVPVVVE